MPNPTPAERADKLRVAVQQSVDANPIPYREVAGVTAEADEHGEIEVTVSYDDGSESRTLFAAPYARRNDMHFDVMCEIDKACTEIRKQRNIFKL